ncbi:MAG: hypothetical protein IH631_09960 [Candidatus Thorarchaeota archaeon]|nr:hypothetical protein [Candidatus Thorarchaeota archaeon]
MFDAAEAHAEVAKRLNVFPISAGHLTFSSDEGTIVVEVECHGESSTLDLTPTEQDTEIAKRMLGL